MISKRPLAEFWTAVPDARNAMESWYSVAQGATWRNFADVKSRFPQTDLVNSAKGQKFVFDIRGNRYRIVCVVRFDRQALYVIFAGSHDDYAKLDIENL